MGYVIAFPDGESALMLVAARLRHIAGTKWGTRRYLTMEVLTNPKSEALAGLTGGGHRHPKSEGLWTLPASYWRPAAHGGALRT